MTDQTNPLAHDQSDDPGRRDFLKGTLLAGAAAVTATAAAPPGVLAQPGMVPGVVGLIVRKGIRLIGHV